MPNRVATYCLLALALTRWALAGEYHGHPGVLCSDCHTTHYSERGALPERAEPGGPFRFMLLTASVNILCLSCHDGTDPTAPDVLDPVTMYEGSGSEFSGGGYFSGPEGVPSESGHDLGVQVEVPFSAPSRSTRLSCASCHTPHGNVSYRNLLPDPDSSGAGVTVVLDTDLFENYHPEIPPDRNASIRAYRSGNIGYKSKITEWCADCHNALHPNSIGNPPAHFLRHPSQVGLEAPDYHVDPDHWVAGEGDGFGASTGDGVEGIPRLRFQAPAATDYNSSVRVAVDNQVICYSCHFAHGGSFKSSMFWPYQTDRARDLYSGCQQCHYK